ncbi:MAG: restriction endonuclease subunit S [Gammaproteobacteria bacterium]
MIKEQLPDSWIVTPLSEIAAINPTIDKRNIDDETLVSFVPMPAVEAESGRIDISICRHFKEVKKGYTGFLERDVIFAKITPSMENLKVAVITKLKNDLGFGSTEFHVIRAPVEVSPEFLYYYVSSKWFRVEAEHNMTGAVGQRRVPTSFLETTPFPLPPTNEQKRIVAKIEELFSELDNGIAALKTAREQLKVYRQAVLKHAFEGKLTAKWREENADNLESPEQLLARIQQEREARYQQQLAEWKAAVKTWEEQGKEGKKPGKPKQLKVWGELQKDVLTKLPIIPDSWAWEKLGFLTTGVEYGTSAKSSESGLTPVIRMGNLQNGSIDWSDLVYTSDSEEIEKYSLRKNDVLFNRTNSPELVGKTAKYKGERPALFAGYLIRVNQIEAIALPDYVNYFLNSPIAKQYGNSVKTDGVNQSNINGEKLQNYPFPFCSIEEQSVIVEMLEEKLSLTDASLQDIAVQLGKAETLRQSILKKAFSGQLVPQDPNDEPASELLARIQAEREATKTKNTKKARKAK